LARAPAPRHHRLGLIGVVPAGGAEVDIERSSPVNSRLEHEMDSSLETPVVAAYEFGVRYRFLAQALPATSATAT